MILSWKPDKRIKIPLYLQLASYLRGKISNGSLKDGTYLPGRRKLVELFAVSKATVDAAMAQLMREGLLISIPRVGIKIDAQNKLSGPIWSTYFKRGHYRPGVEEYKNQFDQSALTIFGFNNEFDMTPFLKSAISETSKKIDTNVEITKYGMLSLRESLAKHLQSIGIKANVENILIGSTSILLGYALFSALMGGGSNFIYEKASLANMISGVHSIGMNMFPVNMDKYGIIASEVEKILPYCKSPLMHIVPANQGPTGITMSKTRANQIMKLINNYRIPLVEVDTMRDTWCDKPFPNPLKSMDNNGSIIYIGSLIKSYPINLELSWAVAEPHVVEYLSDVTVQLGAGANTITQYIANAMFQNGQYYKMMKAARKFIRIKREYTLELCEKYLSGKAVWEEKNCGFHFWLEFPEVNTINLLNKNKFYAVYPGYFFDKSDTNHILLCPPSISGEQLENTIKNLANL